MSPERQSQIDADNYMDRRNTRRIGCGNSHVMDFLFSLPIPFLSSNKIVIVLLTGCSSGGYGLGRGAAHTNYLHISDVCFGVLPGGRSPLAICRLNYFIKPFAARRNGFAPYYPAGYLTRIEVVM